MKKQFIAAVLSLSCLNVLSQDTLTTLNEVMVTANKFPEKTSLTGKVVTIITKEQLLQSGSKDLAQILNEQVGLNINGANSNPGKDKSVYLRGAKVDHTLITIDGIPVYDASGIGSNFDIRLINTDQIERIEILKGSQSTLYGSDAMAGVINIITKKSTKDKQSFAGNISYGSYNSLHAGLNFTGKIKRLDYQLGYAFQSTNGINEATDTTGADGKDLDYFRMNSWNAAVTYTPSTKMKIHPYLRFSTFDQAYDQGAFTDELDLTNKNKNLQTGIRNEFILGKLQLNLLYNFNQISRSYKDDSTLSRNGYDVYSEGNYSSKEHYAEGYAIYKLGSHVKLTGGVDYRQSSTNQHYLSIGYYGPYLSDLGKDSLCQNQIGVYASAVVNTKKGFNLEGAFRYNHHDAYGSNNVYSLNPSYLLNEQVKFFLNISTAYKTPTLYQLYSEYGNRKLKPESAFGTELGIQFMSKQGRMNSRFVYFERTVKDVISFFYDASTWQSFYINQDMQNDFGIEWENEYKLKKNTVLKMNYCYTNGKISTYVDGKYSSYYNLIRRPKHAASLIIGHQAGKKLNLQTGLFMVGKRTDLGFDPVNFTSFEVKLKSYFLWNLYADYKLYRNKITVFADLRNITNSKYTEVYGFNTMGLNGYLGLRWKL